MNHTARLLNLIEEGIHLHGGDLDGAVHRAADTLSLFDGRVILRATVEVLDQGPVHAHVLATLPAFDDEVLDACVVGQGDIDEALGQVAGIWISGVAGPIRSLLDGRPVCMTCRSGVPDGDPASGEVPGNYGFSGLQAFVGPEFSRGLDDDLPELGDSHPWFQYAETAAAARRVHIAKSMLTFESGVGWTRTIEVDGHDVSYREDNWQAEVDARQDGYLIRYAVFEFSPDSSTLVERAALEKAIYYFAANYGAAESVDHLTDDMVAAGFGPDLVSEVEGISTIAFSRHFFEPRGVQFSPVIFRARRDGRVEPNVPLMSIPAFTRAKALAPLLAESMSKEDFLRLCLYNAEGQGILKAMEAADAEPDFASFKLYPCVVPERGVSEVTFKRALDAMQRLSTGEQPAPSNDRAEPGDAQKTRKPWWKFWG